MDSSDVESQLRQIGPFGGLDEPVSKKVIAALTVVSERVEWDDAHEFITEGNEADDFGYVLLAGKVLVTKSSGKELTLSAPALLGEMKQHSATGKRGATVTTSGSCVLLEFEWSALHSRLGRELAAGDWSAF